MALGISLSEVADMDIFEYERWAYMVDRYEGDFKTQLILSLIGSGISGGKAKPEDVSPWLNDRVWKAKKESDVVKNIAINVERAFG